MGMTISRARLNRIKVYCDCCGKQFIAVERSNKKLQRYCSGVCQRAANEPIDSPDEAEIKRRVEVIKHLRRERGIVKITQDMLDWYGEDSK